MHEHFTKLMSLVLDGEATLEERAQLDMHLRTCLACADVWDAWQKADRLLRQASIMVPPAGFLADFCVRLSCDTSLRRLRRPDRKRHLVPARRSP